MCTIIVTLLSCTWVRLWRRGSQLRSCIMLTDQQLNSEPPRGVRGCVRTYVGICFLDVCARGFGSVGPLRSSISQRDCQNQAAFRKDQATSSKDDTWPSGQE